MGEYLDKLRRNIEAAKRQYAKLSPEEKQRVELVRNPPEPTYIDVPFLWKP